MYFETKEVGSVPGLTPILLSVLVKGYGKGEFLENTG